MIQIDNLFDLLAGSLYDKIILKLKRLRGRLLLRRPKEELDWFRTYKQDSRYVKALLYDENLLNLFINKEYRKDLYRDPELRKRFISQLESKF